MLIAIERSRFNYLYKHNTVMADLNCISWRSVQELIKLQNHAINRATVELNEIIPPFEEDHEIILLDYDEETWKYNDSKLLEFSGVKSIIPLTAVGSRLLSTKLNSDFRIEPPVFERTIRFIKERRNLKLRRLAGKELINLFSLETPSRQTTRLIEDAIAEIIYDRQNALNTNIFYSLFRYNTTEGFIPDGNAEFLCKVAVLTRLHNRQDANLVKQGPYYKALMDHLQSINRLSVTDSLEYFLDKVFQNNKQVIEKVREVINAGLSFDMFRVSYYFFAFRKLLNKGENDIRRIEKEIRALHNSHPVEASVAIYSIGSLFSFDQLYEGIHHLAKAPLFEKGNPGKVSENIQKKPELLKNGQLNFDASVDISKTRNFSPEKVDDNPTPEVSTEIAQAANAQNINADLKPDYKSEPENNSIESKISQQTDSSQNLKDRETQYNENLSIAFVEKEEAEDDFYKVIINYLESNLSGEPQQFYVNEVSRRRLLKLDKTGFIISIKNLITIEQKMSGKHKLKKKDQSKLLEFLESLIMSAQKEPLN